MLQLAGAGLLLLGAAAWTHGPAKGQVGGDTFVCAQPRVVDGDTLRCGPQRVRLQGIDAPELPGHCNSGRHCVPGDPYASADNLARLIGSRTLIGRATDIDGYGRTIARCSAGGVDLSCAQVRDRQAVRRYAPISC